MTSLDRLRPLLFPALFTLLAGALLVGLGIWQLQRLHWKEAIIARIEQRTRAPAQPLPPRSAWGSLKPDDYEYRRVTLAGTFRNADESYILRASSDGPGYHVLTPLMLDGGGSVLVDRGSVPLDRRDPATRAAGQAVGRVTITGLMRAPEARNAFTPADDPAKRLFYTRDPTEIAARFGLVDPAPFAVDADATPNPGGLPRGGDTIVAIPNNHFSYALTWFGLALGLLGVFVGVAWKRLAGPSAESIGHESPRATSPSG